MPSGPSTTGGGRTAAVCSAPAGVLVADDASSHPTEIASLRELPEGDLRLVVVTLQIGKGELVATRTS